MTGVLSNIWLPSVQDLRLFSPELALVATIAAVLVVPLIAGRRAYLIAAVALLGTLATLLLTGWVGESVQTRARVGLSPATPMLLADNFTVFFKLFLMLFLAMIIWMWLVGALHPKALYSGVRQNAPEFFVLLLTSALGMALMVSTLNLLVLIIAIETASLPSYAIVASDKRSRAGAEAALKYVLFGATTAAIMVYGVSLLYGVYGTLDLPTMVEHMGAGRYGVVCMLGLLALLVGIGFKVSAVPFHFWCPDVFEGAPIEVTTWLSVASKGAGLGVLLRIVHALAQVPDVASFAMPVAIGIGVVASVTCTIGNLAALRQDSVKRMLAYSSIAHAGYMLMAGAILLQPVEGAIVNEGLSAIVAYLLVYLVMNLGAFAVTGMVAWSTGSDRLSAFTGLGRRAPLLALPMAVCLFSLIGLPPLGGFAAKWWLLTALGHAAALQPWLWSLVVIAALNTALSLYYYVRVIRQMYLRDDESLEDVSSPAGGLIMVNVCAIALLLLGTVLFNPLGERSRTYASHLFGTGSLRVIEGTLSCGTGSRGTASCGTGVSPVFDRASRPVVAHLAGSSQATSDNTLASARGRVGAQTDSHD